MFKYYKINFEGTKQITSQEYTDLLIQDALDQGETVTTARRVIVENRQEAREDGKSVWTTCQGHELVILK